MASHVKVLNLSSGKWIKRSQARNRVDQCLCEWVEEGFTVRDLTLAETIAARSQQARLREPMPWAEIPSLRFDHAGASREWPLIQEANQFAAAAG